MTKSTNSIEVDKEIKRCSLCGREFEVYYCTEGTKIICPVCLIDVYRFEYYAA